MRIVDRLREEHRLIERVAGSLVTFTSSGLVPEHRETLTAFCDFFASYADAYHHGKEEQIVLRALLDAQLPEAGPIAMIREEHDENRAAIVALRACPDGEAATLAIRFCARLWEHIDKEDSVLFGEVEVRLALEATRLERELDEFEARSVGLSSLAQVGESLVARFPPITVLPGIGRGDGCVMCRHFGERCQGIEREWWGELERDEFFARH